MRKSYGYIYVVQIDYDDRPIKIGFAQNPTARVASLQVGCPWPIKCVGLFKGGRAREKEAQAHVKKFNIRCEWLQAAALPKLLEYLRASTYLYETTPASTWDEHVGLVSPTPLPTRSAGQNVTGDR